MYPTLQNAPRVEDSINRLGSVVKEDPTYRACISQSVQTCGNETISRLSHTKEDDSACNMFEDATLKTTCINTINTTLATKKVDAKYCIKLENTAKINCENQVTVLQAIMAKDQSLCEKIVLTNTTLSGSEALQDPLNEANDPKSQCLMRVITASKPSTESIKACDAI